MKNIIKISFVVLFSALSYFVVGSIKQISGNVVFTPQQEQTDKKEIHTIESITILSDHINRSVNSHVYTFKTKIAKAFFNLNFVKAISKKKENKSVLAKNHFSYTIIPISFKQTDIIFPFHNFW